MSRAISPSTEKPYGVLRVVSVWNLARSGFYAARKRIANPRRAAKRGPKVLSGVELLSAIREQLKEPHFTGEGYCKIWARLRFAGTRTSKDRVLRLMREHQLLSPSRRPEPRAPIPMKASSSPNGRTRCGEPMPPVRLRGAMAP